MKKKFFLITLMSATLAACCIGCGAKFSPTFADSIPAADTFPFYKEYGTQDLIALESSSKAVDNITTLSDKFTDKNFTWQTTSGGHDFNIWYLGYYNFAKLVFK